MAANSATTTTAGRPEEGAGTQWCNSPLGRTSLPYWLARTRLDHAVWLAERGQPDHAAVLAEQAAVVFAELGAGPALVQARRLVSTAAVVTV